MLYLLGKQLLLYRLKHVERIILKTVFDTHTSLSKQIDTYDVTYLTNMKSQQR